MEGHLSKLIKNEKEIEELTMINGIPLAEIDRRAQPLKDKTQDKEFWRCRSFNGFLDEGQSIKDCLLCDWNLVTRLGTTHLCLVNHLKAIIGKYNTIRVSTKRGPDAVIKFTYTAIDLSGLIQNLTVSHRFYLGDQWTLFYNPSLPENDKWKEEFKITNESVNISILIGGGLNVGIIQYIEDYGFYEGGINNEYRIDPEVLITVLTGRVTERVVGLQIEKLKRKIKEIEQEKTEWETEKEQYIKQEGGDPNQLKMIDENISQKITQISYLQQEIVVWTKFQCC